MRLTWCGPHCRSPFWAKKDHMKAFRRFVGPAAVALWSTLLHAEVAPILLEACSAMQPASKRMECLRAANAVRQDAGPAYRGSTPPQAAFTAPQATKTSRVTSAAPRSMGGPTCYTGPRGGTYTITASGRKNYSGC